MRRGIYPNVELELTKNRMIRKELGAKVGMTQTLIGYKLNGKSEISFKEAMKIKNALNSNLTLEELFEETKAVTGN